MVCGQHALNDLLGLAQFLSEDMVKARAEVLAEVSWGSEDEHRIGNGWYSHSVLARILHNTMPPIVRMVLGRVGATDWEPMATRSDIVGPW